MKIILFANTEWYLYNFRRSLAHSLNEEKHQVLFVSPDGPYGRVLQRLGFRWIKAPMVRRSLNPFREFLLLNWLCRLIQVEHVDLIHGFTIKCAIYGALAARMAGYYPRVNAISGLGYVFINNDFRARMLRPFVRGIMRFALGGKKSRLILQNSDDVAFFQNTRIVNPASIRLIKGSGVNCDLFHSGAIRKKGEPMRVLLAARLLWDKGLKEYIEAAGKLKRDGRTVHFLLAGNPDPGNPAAVPESTVKKWDEEGDIEWLGHVNDMPALLATIHVMVLPSYREGLPKSLVEAAACGLALIATDVPGCREVVTDGVDGLLIPPKNADALANAIARLDDDPEFAARLGSAAKEKALREFDEEIIIAQTKAVYRELLANDQQSISTMP